ncbi:thiamine pyrophosphate-binding protein [Acinetobacter bereziniae]|uniref:Thiamine pyrophosphate-binding protein n=2 Tax=Acinetobacter bereziniae TaxID=106648 RepID=A0A8I1DEN2_ACIBZ|nr:MULTISPECIES: thiamine pyrophosphate-binding protein [Acinetobacter]MEC8124915.1 thiamine pyrophosphate-binding protein [Pseudomonadota bacterium]MBJ8421227.1 thiamine pyrophosphate-binding protein [Acinetobacter bereziniae]MBJ9949585.1 thiamine pyrophosphate-binding protein [Acinetobacter bereziniae]MCU4473695.1 thiamine pyrophosphate-binding protein [Acinetobacter bereziniae]MCU4540420.1 thiamine pyrophosphate-binding protein [Acinetobacter bereziniae]
MTERVNVGEAIARVLEAHQVESIYGVISIHNLPIADAVGRREKIRFVAARGEAGAVTMADGHARFKGLGVALTSTGAGAGNAVGSLIEAMNAGSPVLHLTGQVEREYLDRDASFIHETKDQLTFLRASSKAAFRITSPDNAVGVIREAIRVATTVPMGPVSVELPIDVQAAEIDLPLNLGPVKALELPQAEQVEVDLIVQEVKQAKRPIFWIGGGTLKSVEEVKAIADLGIPIVSSTHARGVLADDHPRSLGAFHNSAAVEQLLKDADLLVVVGSRLRSNETKTYSVQFPDNIIQIDANPVAQQRNYTVRHFVCADAKHVLQGVVAGLADVSKVDAEYDKAIVQAKQAAIDALRTQLDQYALICDYLRAALPQDGIFVRDITMSGSTWGSRLFPVQAPNLNIHSLAGAIGLGLATAIGASIANPDKKVIGLVGDGGLMLGIGEIATMAQENTNMVLMIMNDGGYGVMRGIQNNYFGGRQYFNELHTPDYQALGEAMGVKSWKVGSADEFNTVIQQAVDFQGPSVIELDMKSIGPLNFAGPPQKKLY